MADGNNSLLHDITSANLPVPEKYLEILRFIIGLPVSLRRYGCRLSCVFTAWCLCLKRRGCRTR